ncbi:DEAD/DEAH box helicase [Thalassomonas haliotis]|uniref:DEAD/DEAH box helicase n=1 Tax=Thalassomonas haliotis TaxID=485448 RepID=A0ABY7VE57_9GAMM|nr:DEAD/DEAH box helicase [Thalassomonas haliotis]WDE11954.1 DEAD/DEAH box helicase [Thalassomonas haliotis]
MGFSSLGLQASLVKSLAEQGYQQPTPVQQAAIPVILKGQDIMAGAQTGTGKTAAFALPILQLLTREKEKQQSGKSEAVIPSPGALVLTPTRELAQQVHASFEKYGAHLPFFSRLAYGGVSINAQVEGFNAGVDILVATPGRLLDHLAKGSLTLEQLKFLVFDEADRMLDMGFIDDIKRILKQLPEQRQTMLFSATFDAATVGLSKKLLNQPEMIQVDQANTAATQVEQIIYTVDPDRKRELISHVIGARNWHQVLIFTRSKQSADMLAAQMSKDGVKTQAIHGDKSQGAREKALAEFKSGQTRALVATDVASRGLDIRQLQYVINYELPFNPEDYIHRIGRSGRAGNAGLAISLVSTEEEYLLAEIEAVLGQALPQQWLEGYEPDLTREIKSNKKTSRSGQKRRAKQRASGGRNRRR